MTLPVLAVLAVPTVPAVLTVNKYHVEQRDYPADDEVDILLHIIKTNTMNFPNNIINSDLN